MTPPEYTRPLATVVERVIGDGYRSAMLPLAMELRQFGYGGDGSNPNPQQGPPPEMSCWIQPNLPGSPGQYLIPRITKTTFSKK